MAFQGTGDIRGFITGGCLRVTAEGHVWDFYDQAANVLTTVPYAEFAEKFALVPSIEWAHKFGSVNGVEFYDFLAPRFEPEPAPPAPAPVVEAKSQDYWDRFVERLFGIFR